MNEQQLNQYITHFYTIVGPNDQTKKEIINSLQGSTQVPVDQWSLTQDIQLEGVLTTASEKSDDHYIIHRRYRGIGNSIQEWVYYQGEKFQLSRFVNRKPDLEDIRNVVKQQRVQKLKQQKQKAQQQLEQIEEQLKEWSDEDSEEE